jgi:hypothetical protein
MVAKFARRLVQVAMWMMILSVLPSATQAQPGENGCGPLLYDVNCGHDCRRSNQAWSCRLEESIPRTAACIQYPGGYNSCGVSDPYWYCECRYGGGGGF